MAKGFEFHNLNTLFGVTLATGETVISNAPNKDPRAGGLPKGHPDMKSYLGVPIKHRDEMLGMLGIETARAAMSQIVDAMKPLLVTAGSMIQSIRSINARRAIECELQEKHKLLNGVIHNITDALVITDHNGVIREVNKATEETFGYFGPELLGKKYWPLLGRREQSDFEAGMHRNNAAPRTVDRGRKYRACSFCCVPRDDQRWSRDANGSHE